MRTRRAGSAKAVSSGSAAARTTGAVILRGDRAGRATLGATTGGATTDGAATIRLVTGGATIVREPGAERAVAMPGAEGAGTYALGGATCLTGRAADAGAAEAAGERTGGRLATVVASNAAVLMPAASTAVVSTATRSAMAESFDGNTGGKSAPSGGA